MIGVVFEFSIEFGNLKLIGFKNPTVAWVSYTLVQFQL